MKDEHIISVKNMPKGFKLLFILLPVVGLFMLSLYPDNDFFFLYPTGEYIVNNGIPFKDFLSMHGNMDIIVQQWLIDVIFYGLYSKLGIVGLTAFIALCYIAFSVLMYRLCYLISENWFSAAVCAFVADIFISGLYMTTRPHAFSFVLFVLELFALESYVKTKKPLYLALIPIVSLLLINAHASMWLMMFVLALPYAAEAIPFKFKKIKQEPCCNFRALLITGAVSFAVGFINPYGFKAMTYIFTSFGYDEINKLVFEMKSPSLKDTLGILYFALILAVAVVTAITRYKNFKTRFVLLFTGTLILAMMNYKSMGLFFIAAMPAYCYYLKDVDFKITIEKNKKRTKKETVRLCVLSVLLVAVGACAVFAAVSTDKKEVEKSPYESLNEAVKILDSEKGDIVLFTGFDYGQYLEFKGYHPYIDGRAELFLKDNNHEYDYLKEYYDMITGKLDYKEFVDRYNFTHLIVNKNEPDLYKGLLSDGDYELIYEDTGIYMFRQKPLDIIN